MFVVFNSRRYLRWHNLKGSKKFNNKPLGAFSQGLFVDINSREMSSGDPDKWNFLQNILGFSNSNSKPNSRRASQSSSHSGSSHSEDGPANEYYFNSSENRARRPSTIDDEARVIGQLKEILAYQESNVSNWIIESEVKSLCSTYTYLLKPHKEGFLKVLACEFAVDHEAVCKTARQIAQLQEEEYFSRNVTKLEERLKNSLTPQYSWLFTHVGRLERGVKFLVDLRTDVLDLASQMDSSDPAFIPVQQLNKTLRDLLSLWFSVGFLDLERVTWKSSCQMLQKISEYEAVHPVRSWTDLKRRVGLYRRCFVYTHSSMAEEPLVVLHTALCDEIADSMSSIVTGPSRLSMDAGSGGGTTLMGLPLQPETEDPRQIKAAVFYSITSTQKGLQGIELGNYLIKRVAQEVQSEFPLVNQFSTLSPIPGFRSWLSEKLKAVDRGENEIVTAEEEFKFDQILGKKWAADLQTLFKSNAWLENSDLVSHLKLPLMRLCARYLYLEKHRGSALNSVANFHLKNGAVMWRINWNADLSPRGLGNSCGLMVNYRYFLEDTESNSRNYLEHHVISASEQVTQLAAGAERLMTQLTSKM